MGGKVMPAREPTDVTDLAQERGRQHRPDPEQLQQAGVGLGDGGLDAGLDGGDPLLQLADIGDQASGQRVTAGAPAGVTPANTTAARLAVRLRLARRGLGRPAAGAAG
jgi:hypothetical protein